MYQHRVISRAAFWLKFSWWIESCWNLSWSQLSKLVCNWVPGFHCRGDPNQTSLVQGVFHIFCSFLTDWACWIVYHLPFEKIASCRDSIFTGFPYESFDFWGDICFPNFLRKTIFNCGWGRGMVGITVSPSFFFLVVNILYFIVAILRVGPYQLVMLTVRENGSCYYFSSCVSGEGMQNFLNIPGSLILSHNTVDSGFLIKRSLTLQSSFHIDPFVFEYSYIGAISYLPEAVS